jgi:hypothetical protein
MAEDWTVRLSEDEGAVILDYLDRWERSREFPVLDQSEERALVNSGSG